MEIATARACMGSGFRVFFAATAHMHYGCAIHGEGFVLSGGVYTYNLKFWPETHKMHSSLHFSTKIWEQALFRALSRGRVKQGRLPHLRAACFTCVIARLLVRAPPRPLAEEKDSGRGLSRGSQGEKRELSEAFHLSDLHACYGPAGAYFPSGRLP